MYLVIFSAILILANIYCFKNSKYLYLFFPCILFLPDYYGIEINESIPLLTATRIMYVIFYIYAFLNRKQQKTIKNISLKELPKIYYFLALYFILRIFTNLYYITTYSQAIKTIIIIVFEQLMILVAIYILSPTREEIINVAKAIVCGACVLFVVGVFESITFICPFDVLYTVSRDMLNIKFIRLGLLRSVTTMGMPGLYGNMCVLITPLIFYLHHITGQRKYMIACFLDILAIIHSGCRSDIVYFIILTLIYLFMLHKDRARLKNCLKNAFIVFVMLFIWIFILSISSQKFNYYYVGTGKSVLNTVGFNFDLDDGAPEGTGGYGVNPDIGGSRLIQFSAISFTAQKNPVFGLGSGAQNRREIHLIWNGTSFNLYSYDVGIIQIFCDEGIIGIISVMGLLSFIFVSSRKTIFYRLSLLSYLLTTLSTSNMYIYCFIFIIIFWNFKEKVAFEAE